MGHFLQLSICDWMTSVPFIYGIKGSPKSGQLECLYFVIFFIMKGTAWYERRIGVIRNKLFFTSSKCIIFFYIYFSIFVLDKAINQIVLISCKLKWMCSAAYRNYSCFTPYLHYMLIWLVSILCFLGIIWGCIIFHIRIIFNLLLIDLTI